MLKLPEGITPDDFRDQNELFVGSKGFMATSGRGEGMRLAPKAAMRGFVTPKFRKGWELKDIVG